MSNNFNRDICSREIKIAIIGLGYVGLPLAIEFSKKYSVVGYDISEKRINDLKNNKDNTNEISKQKLKESKSIFFTNSVEAIKNCNVYIVTVPTPIDENKRPNLNPLINASSLIAKVIKVNDIVIYESTVYPGATEEDCIPVIEKKSGLIFNKDFFAGYSPERINPGDKKNTLTTIKKITSGSTIEIAEIIDKLYSSIIEAGTFKANSIRVAEAAKLIENVQRDVNISLINELHQIFNLMDIDTNEVIEAASTKWNFMKLKPGLVGGHCIGVDPYYLLHRSGQVGYVPDLIRTAREINDSMASYIAGDFVKKLLNENTSLLKKEISILGFTFKENCPDIRNTKVVELYHELKSYGLKLKIIDPIVNINEVENNFNIKIQNDIELTQDSICLLAVGHDQLINELKKVNIEYLYDYKGILGSDSK